MQRLQNHLAVDVVHRFKVFHGILIKMFLHVGISTLNSEEVDSAALLSPVVDLHNLHNASFMGLASSLRSPPRFVSR